ncbi:alcohol dehydrogenase catalytic domain-containing protein [Rhodococcus erythropolis]|uniref:alcohol dehydrogenase catalytic domain-containing protein n=1 Tax=Rhodococcus erythropolis TaxID=1833 RepID=UPI0037B44F34
MNAPTQQSMKAYRVPAGGGHGVWRDVPVPSVGPQDVLIRLVAAGICRTDLEAMDHGYGQPADEYTLGHENVGRIVQIGSDVEQLEIGEMVAVSPASSCGNCEYCREGNDNVCQNRPRNYGIRGDGGLAEYMAARHRDVLPIGDLDPFLVAPAADAGAAAYGVIRRVLPFVRDNGYIAVIGVGGVGAFALQLLQHLTPATVIAVDMENRLENAVKRGADLGVVSGPTTVDEIKKITGGRGVDAVLEFVGVEATLKIAAAITKPLGAIGVVGTGGGTLPFSFGNPDFGVHVFNSASCSLSELKQLFDIVGSGKIEIDTTLFDFEDLEHGYDELRAGNLLGRGVLRFSTT